jgi:hypothetical protein
MGLSLLILPSKKTNYRHFKTLILTRQPKEEKKLYKEKRLLQTPKGGG